MCESNPWWHWFAKALILQSLCMDSRVRAWKALAQVQGQCRASHGPNWPAFPLTRVPAPDPEGQHLSGLLQKSSTCVLAGPQRFCPAVSCHSHCKSGENSCCRLCLGYQWRQQAAPSYGHIHAPFGWGRVTYCHTAPPAWASMQVYIPSETSNTMAIERSWLGFLWTQTFKYHIRESMKKFDFGAVKS